jgi:hypothetical protein
VSGQLYAPAALPPGEEPPVPIGYEAGWAPEPVWTLWSREKSIAPAGDWTPAAQPTELSPLTTRFQRLNLYSGAVYTCIPWLELHRDWNWPMSHTGNGHFWGYLWEHWRRGNQNKIPGTLCERLSMSCTSFLLSLSNSYGRCVGGGGSDSLGIYLVHKNWPSITRGTLQTTLHPRNALSVVIAKLHAQ